MLQPLLHRLRLRLNTSAWSSGGPTGDRRIAEEEQLGRCAAGQSIYYWLYVNSTKLILAAIYFRQVRVAGSSYTAAPTHVLGVAALPAPAA